MDFWQEHTVMFILGLVVCPRILLLWFGLIPPMQIPPILGLVFVPRMLLAGYLTTEYSDTNVAVVGLCWVLAVGLDVLGLFFKASLQGLVMKNMQEQMAYYKRP
jgi:hypothetical protein